MDYAIIQDNKVINIAVAEPDYAAEQGWVLLEGGAGIGWQYVDGEFLPPPRDIEAEWEAVRKQRDQLLTESDVYVLPDRWAAMTPEQQQAWTDYRQTLRDIPQTFNDPADVVWPQAPQ